MPKPKERRGTPPPTNTVIRPVVNKDLGHVIQVIEEFRKLNPAMTANVMLAFLNIAIKQGITPSEMQDILHLPSSSNVRAISALATTHRPGVEGLNLIRYEEDIRDRRVKHLYLRPEGERVWSTIKRILDIKETHGER